jgi:hypothetical protein
MIIFLLWPAYYEITAYPCSPEVDHRCIISLMLNRAPHRPNLGVHRLDWYATSMQSNVYMLLAAVIKILSNVLQVGLTPNIRALYNNYGTDVTEAL